MRDIFRRLVAPEMGSLPKSNAAGLHHVCARRHYAFLCPSITAAQLLPSLPCDVVPVPGASIPASSTMAVGKHSPHRRTINHCVQQMRRSGVLHRIQANTLSSPMTAVQEMRHEPVSFVTSAPLVLILSAGVAIATVLLCVERFVTRRQAIL
ncbi:uncharacterized protein [Periplaneta americana]|uniref:uncharacterized protein n=1 Tax=Periplaneta americana TaxID=6978 RepID=UPI0037E808E7